MNREAENAGFYRQIGRRIAERRGRVELSQGELGERVGLTRSTIANIEAGRQQVLVHVLVRLARVLGVSLGDLLPRDQERPVGPAVAGLSADARELVELTMKHAAGQASPRR